MRTPMQALDAACRVFGSQTQLAHAIRLRSQSITDWRLAHSIPEDRAVPIEAVVAAKWSELDDETRDEVGTPVRAEELRPDRVFERDRSGQVVFIKKPVQAPRVRRIPRGGALRIELPHKRQRAAAR